MSRTFEEASEILKGLGTEFSEASEFRGEPPNREECPLPFFDSIHLPFTPEEWCRLCMGGGDYYVGGCCGNMSALQDELNDVFRIESGWVGASKLARIAQLNIEHDYDKDHLPNFAEIGDIDIVKMNWVSLSPWDKMAAVWHLVKDHYVPEKPSGFGKKHEKRTVKKHKKRTVKNEIEIALHIARNGLSHLSHIEVFTPQEHRGQFQDSANKLMALYRVVPALRTLWLHIEKLGPPTLKEAFALFDKERDDIASNRLGLCIYATREEAEKLLELWRKDDEVRKDKFKNFKPVDEYLTIRPVRVSVEKGLEFLD